MAIESSAVPQSRRALLAGALGGLAAAVAAALGRPDPASAAAGSTMIIGSEANYAGTANTQLLANSSVVAFKLLQNGPGTALMGYATPATGETRGVYGRSDSPNGFGVQARNAGAQGSGAAIQAIGVDNIGVDVTTAGSNRAALKAIHSAGGLAIYAESTGVAVSAISTSAAALAGHSSSWSGVSGSSNSAAGVSGISGSGDGVRGFSGTGYAGQFDGQVKVSKNLDIGEMTAPVAPTANTGRLFVRDNGAGKTQLCVIFPTGAIQVLSTEPA